MPKLIVPAGEPNTDLTPTSIQGNMNAVQSGAEIGDVQRTQGAAAYASGAGIGRVQMQAGQEMASLGMQFFDQANSALEDANYNDLISKAQLDYSSQAAERVQKSYDENGNPTFGTMQSDLDGIYKNTMETYGANIANPNVRAKFNATMQDLHARGSLQAQSQSRNQQLDYMQGSLTQALQSNSNLALQGDPSNKDLYFGRNMKAIDDAVAKGYLDYDKALQLKEKSRIDIYKKSLDMSSKLYPFDTGAVLNSASAKELNLTELEYQDLKHQNSLDQNAVLRHQAQTQKAQEQVEKNQSKFVANELEVGIAKGAVTEADVNRAYKDGKIDQDSWKNLTLKSMSASGISASKMQKMTDISYSIGEDQVLSGKFSDADINEHYNMAIKQAEATTGKPLSLSGKAALAATYKGKVSAFTDEIRGTILSEKDPNKVAEAVQAYDFLNSKNPLAVDGMDKETQAVISIIASRLGGTNQNTSQVVEDARKSVISLDPTLRELRTKSFNEQELFKPVDLEKTINNKFAGGFLSGSSLSSDLIPMYERLLKEAYTLTGDQDAAITLVKDWTKDTVGPSGVNSSEGFLLNKQTIMMLPPEKLYGGQYSAKEIRGNINTDLTPIITDNANIPAGLTSDQIFIGSDAVTRQDLQNPSYSLYYVDKNGVQQPLLDKTGIPVRYTFDGQARDAIEQQRTIDAQIIHERAVKQSQEGVISVPQTNTPVSKAVSSAQTVYSDNPVMAGVAASQAILESRLTGTPSDLAAKHNNYFGIKGSGTAGTTNMATTEFQNGKSSSVNAGFAAFNSPEESFQRHKELMTNGITNNPALYQEVLKAKTVEEAAQALQKAGYATDPNYAKKLIDIYHKHVEPQMKNSSALTPMQKAETQGALKTPAMGLGGGTPVTPQLAQTPAYNNAITFQRQLAAAGRTKSPLVTIIDYSKPVTEPRMFVVNTETGKVLLATEVTQGAPGFSNTPNSHQSSLGVFMTDKTYTGSNGYSLRIRGLEQGKNDNVYQRNVVVHGANYIGKGKAGRSFGCFAVPEEVAPRVINLIKDGTVIYAYGPSEQGSKVALGNDSAPMSLKDFENAQNQQKELRSHLRDGIAPPAPKPIAPKGTGYEPV